MKNVENLKNSHIYFIGIGGISMSGLAKMCVNHNIKVSGSDIMPGKESEILSGMGVKIYSTHDAKNITDDITLAVFSGAIKEDNPELVECKRKNILVMERSEFLGKIASGYRKVIAVSGTHGKTTTTAMIGVIFARAGLKPTVHLGGESIDLSGNTILGDREYLIVEACEYRESFRYLSPHTLVITNIELDHLDFYPDYDSIHRAFCNLASRSQNLITYKNSDIVHPNKIEIGSDFTAENINFVDAGYNFDVYKSGKFFGDFRLNMIGLHNVSNALFSIAVSEKFGIGVDILKSALAGFHGVERRMECIGEINDTKVIIDYAHHPTEIRCSMDAISSVYERVLYVFQPHTYSRTLKLFDDFKNVLNSKNDVALFRTYPAREKEIAGGRAEDLFCALTCKNKSFFYNEQTLLSYMKNVSKDYDCILILGAGNLADNLKNLFINKHIKS